MSEKDEAADVYATFASTPTNAGLVKRMHIDRHEELMTALLKVVNDHVKANSSTVNTTQLVGSLMHVTACVVAQRTSTTKKECTLALAAGEYLHISSHAVGVRHNPSKPAGWTEEEKEATHGATTTKH